MIYLFFVRVIFIRNFSYKDRSTFNLNYGLMFSFVCICTPFHCGFSRSNACVRSSFMLNCSARNLAMVKAREKSESTICLSELLKKKEITRIEKDSELESISDFHAFSLSLSLFDVVVASSCDFS